MKMFGGGIVKRKAQRISGNTQLVIHCFFIKKKKKCLETKSFFLWKCSIHIYLCDWAFSLPPNRPK